METNGRASFDLKKQVRKLKTDIELQRLVYGIDAHENGLADITLVVGGAVISGKAIGVREYYERLGQQMVKNITDEQVAKTQLESYRKKGIQIQEKTDRMLKNDDVSDEEWFESLPRFIHLTNLQMTLGFGLTAAPIVLRLKIESIDGFALGSIASHTKVHTP